jgi:hypothetical protein
VAGKRVWFWLYPPFSWASYLLLSSLYAVLLIVGLGAGKGLGVPSLLWHDDRLTQFLAGIAVVALGAYCGVVAYLLDQRESARCPPAFGDKTIGGVAAYVSIPLTILVAAMVIGAIRQQKTSAHGTLALIGPLALDGVVLWLALGRLRALPTLDLVPRDYRMLVAAALEFWAHDAQEHPANRMRDPILHALQAVLTGAGLVLYVASWICERWVPAAVAICLALGLIVGTWGFLRFWFPRYAIFWMVVVLLVPGLPGAIRHDVSIPRLGQVTFPDLGPPKPSPAKEVPVRAALELLADAEVLPTWSSRQPEPRPPLVVVATSGGASRAAVWTINVLGTLERAHPGFLRHVRLITGASGGMVGAAHLVAGLADLGAEAPSAPWLDGILEDAAKDSLTPIARTLLYPLGDRGLALEAAWEKHSKGRLAKTFRGLLDGERGGWLPSLVYAPMMVEDGRRLIISNLRLDAVGTSLRPWDVQKSVDLPSISSVQLFECSGEGIADIKLGTVARLNATFPWVTSAALLHADRERRVVDAGYYDNYGVDIATAWIRQNAAWLKEYTGGVLLLQIRDTPSAESQLTAEPSIGFLHKRVSTVSTPIEAFFSAREASMSFRNDQKVDALAQELGSDPRCPAPSRFFATEIFEYDGTAPLEWYLGRAAVDDLKGPPRKDLVDSIESWWLHRFKDIGPVLWPPCGGAR